MDRYVAKTVDLLEAEGWDVAPMEMNYPIVRYPTKKERATDPGAKPSFVGYRKKDIWGLDLIAKNETRIVGIQVKAYESQKKIVEAIKQVEEHAPFPKVFEIWLVFWKKRSRKPPDILRRGKDWGV